MFMRLLQVRVNPDKIFDLERTYERIVLPELQKVRGCLYAGLVQSLEDKSDGMSLTMWESQGDAAAYEKSGKYEELVNATRSYFSDSSEWTMQLTANLELEYRPVTSEPIVKAYDADLPQGGQQGLDPKRTGNMYLRIVSMRINPEKIQEFIGIYKQEIIPALRKVDGCHDAYLAESLRERNEVLSITIWDSLQHARAYEITGEFDKLKAKLQHTFSNLSLWKIGLDETLANGTQGKAKKAVTSDDVAVRTYNVVVAKAFR
jgi:heme-degrading monooxygenase HmoA